MSVTLDQLSPLLIQQFEELPKGRENQQLTKNYQIKFDNGVIVADVWMERVPFKFTASVEMNPVNEKVRLAFVDHFLNQSKVKFDSFHINETRYPNRGNVRFTLNHECKSLS